MGKPGVQSNYPSIEMLKWEDTFTVFNAQCCQGSGNVLLYPWRHRAQVWHQVSRRLLQGLLCTTELPAFPRNSGVALGGNRGNAVGLFRLWKETRCRRRDGRKAIIISECAFSLGRPHRDGRSEEEKSWLSQNHGRTALKSSLNKILSNKTNCKIKA